MTFLFPHCDAGLPEQGPRVGEGVVRGEVRDVRTDMRGSCDVFSLTAGDGEGADTLQSAILFAGSVQKFEVAAC